MKWVSIVGVLTVIAAGALTVPWLVDHVTTSTGSRMSTSASPAPASSNGSTSVGSVTGLRFIPQSESVYTACPAPNGGDWRLIELGDRLTGEVKTTGDRLAFTVNHARWREIGPGAWQVDLDTEMENGTTKDLEHGSWNYAYLVLGKRQLDLDTDGCYSAEPMLVKPGLQSDARAGFVVTCKPVGVMVLVVQSGQQSKQVGEDASITVTRAVEPGDC